MNPALSPLALWLLGPPSGPGHSLEALDVPVLHWLSPYSGPRNSGTEAGLGKLIQKAGCPSAPHPTALVLLFPPSL